MNNFFSSHCLNDGNENSVFEYVCGYKKLSFIEFYIKFIIVYIQKTFHVVNMVCVYRTDAPIAKCSVISITSLDDKSFELCILMRTKKSEILRICYNHRATYSTGRDVCQLRNISFIAMSTLPII